MTDPPAYARGTDFMCRDPLVFSRLAMTESSLPSKQLLAVTCSAFIQTQEFGDHMPQSKSTNSASIKLIFWKFILCIASLLVMANVTVAQTPTPSPAARRVT